MFENEDAGYQSPTWLSMDLSLSEEIEERIKSLGEIICYRKGRFILNSYEEAGGLYFLIKGKVNGVYTSITGKEKTIFIFKPPCFFAEAPFFSNVNMYLDMIAAEDSTVVYIDRNIINSIQKTNTLLSALVMSLAVKGMILANQLNDTIYMSAKERVLKALFGCAKEQNIELNSRGLIIRVTQERISSITGLHRITVAKVFSKLKEEGFIKNIRKSTILLIPQNKSYERC